MEEVTLAVEEVNPDQIIEELVSGEPPLVAVKKAGQKEKKKAVKKEEKKAEEKKARKATKKAKLASSLGLSPSIIYNRLAKDRRESLFKLLKIKPELVTVEGRTYPAPFKTQKPPTQKRLNEFLAQSTESNALYYVV